MESEVCRELLALCALLADALGGGALYGPSVPEADGAWICMPPPPCACCIDGGNPVEEKYDPLL
jgi:hypothetical protein